jgi:outer membrane protein OmpA-like peptidoglycan-associated protein
MGNREREPVPVAHKAPTDKAAALRSAEGEQLPAALAAEISAQFGASFGDVRIHADAAAQAEAKLAGAQAFTRGNHIAFASGRYNPSSSVGRQLIAHELAHVVQQRTGGRAADAEARAARAGADVAAGRAVNTGVLGGAPVGMQMQPEPAPQPEAAPEQKQKDAEQAASKDWRTFTHVFDKFATNKDTLTAKHLQDIDDLAFAISLHTSMLARGKAKIEIVGHADSVGKEPPNEELGGKRASAVRAALEKKLTPREGEKPLNLEWSARSAGEKELLVPTPDNAPEARNRAVEVKVTIESLPAEPKAPEQPKIDLNLPKDYEPPPPTGPRRRDDDDWWKKAEKNDRRIKELEKKIGKKKPRSLQDVIVDGVMDKIVNPIIDELPISKEKKKWLREKARAGVEAGTVKACEAAADVAGLSGDDKEAFKKACEAAIKQKESKK